MVVAIIFCVDFYCGQFSPAPPHTTIIAPHIAPHHALKSLTPPSYPVQCPPKIDTRRAEPVILPYDVFFAE